MRSNHELFIREPYFSQIESGEKTSEGRIAKDKYMTIKKGDVVTFRPNKGTGQVAGSVIAVNKYTSFKSMLESEGIASMLPGVSSIEEGVGIYSSFGTYAEDVKKYGCVAVVFKLSS